ncbi:polysaccharide biosynthesis protein [Meinhardsimonia xiamenensis]|uniref:polysaccharide biosynthesis protein n=1 Tax=Meinhardsimonia xiamenensis TaxID=990712 RepID=UPI001FE0E485|nr:nucleoside-diphosphate sugar epimerase/dehydratase [Meinhardsimonia xiamenensis]
MKLYRALVEWIAALPRPTKQAIIFVTDLLLVPISFFLALAIRVGSTAPLSHPQAGDTGQVIMLVTFAAIPTIHFMGLARMKVHTFELRAARQVLICALFLGMLAMGLSYIFLLPMPRSVPVMFTGIYFTLSAGVRLLARELLVRGPRGERVPVAIYGAGAAGIQLASALRIAAETRPVAFVDDNPSLWGMMVAGLQVYPPSRLEEIVRRKGIARVLIAMPSAPEARIRELVRALSKLPVEVQVLPSYIDLMAGKGLAESLRPVEPDELLGRDAVNLDVPDIAKAYAGRSVMVTGAGGSIGSELCRQLLDCHPARIVLFEQSEFALYSIDRELREMTEGRGIEIVSRLGSITDPARVRAVMAEAGVEIVLHAAAYKHVPLVEENELEGARNNVLGTRVVAEAALEAGVERFILVSTDKAVRPANIMGATKRMAELVIQDLQTRSPKTRFAMVRFGNVLGSSGSVLPLFQKQIAAGGPVTVTDPEMTRFFMTIPEASRLVLLAGAYARGGDVFVLDMGEPKKIIDIARQMIELSGARVRDPETGEGDIEIRIIGRRPGEKLYEELLIDNDSLTETPHPKILRAEETMLSQIEVAAMLREIEAAVETGDAARLRKLVAARVEGYAPAGEGVAS